MERIQKILARAGIASRRASELLIEQERVSVNGRVAHLGESAEPDRDSIRVDGQLVKAAPAPVWILLHKPPGVVVSDRAQGQRKMARELVSFAGRLFAVGRLDLESEGLMLLTNDGDLAERLSHPRHEHEKEYRVLLDRPPDEEQVGRWSRGLMLADGYRTHPVRIWRERSGRTNRWLRVVMREGHKRQIRESARAVGLRVERLIRIRLGPFHLGTILPGEWRIATPAEVDQIAHSPAALVRRGRGGREAERRSARAHGGRSRSPGRAMLKERG